jgi:hypothetical protein
MKWLEACPEARDIHRVLSVHGLAPRAPPSVGSGGAATLFGFKERCCHLSRPIRCTNARGCVSSQGSARFREVPAARELSRRETGGFRGFSLVPRRGLSFRGVICRFILPSRLFFLAAATLRPGQKLKIPKK